MMELMEKGGVMMLPIMVSSVLALAVIVERALAFSRNRSFGEAAWRRLLDKVRAGDSAGAVADLSDKRRPTAVLLKAVLMVDGDAEGRAKRASLEGDEILRRMSQRVEWLAIIGALTPLMGLLGTVVGMIRVFSNVAAVGDVNDISLLAGGIWEALLTTAAGLAVALPVLITYHALQGKIDAYAFEMRKYGEELILLLQGLPSRSVVALRREAGGADDAPQTLVRSGVGADATAEGA